MSRPILARLVAATLASLAIVLMGTADLAMSQEKDAPAKATAKKDAKTKGRLPAYYSQVVSDEQRGKIYEIQAQYRERIDALKAQLAALVKEQDEKINAVLTAEQLKKIEDLKAAAKAKQADAAAKKPEVKKEESPEAKKTAKPAANE